jgi:hypothetical protein
VKTPSKHPRTCRLCDAELLPSRKGQPRLYCAADVRPCKERNRVLRELADRAARWDDDGRPKVAAQIRRRITTLRERWGLDPWESTARLP